MVVDIGRGKYNFDSEGLVLTTTDLVQKLLKGGV